MNRRRNKPVWAAAALLLAVLFAAAAAAEEQNFTVFTDGAGQTYEWFEVQKLHYGADHKVTAVSGRFERYVPDDEDGHGEYPADGEVYTYPLAEDFRAEMTAGMTADTMDNVPVTDLYQWYLDAYLDGQAPESGELVFQCDLPPEADEFTPVDFWFVTTRIRLNDRNEVEFMEYVYVPWG